MTIRAAAAILGVGVDTVRFWLRARKLLDLEPATVEKMRLSRERKEKCVYINLYIPPSVVEAIDQAKARGESRGDFVTQAVMAYLQPGEE